MSRLLWRLLAWLLFLPLLVALAIPFTQGGSRMVLDVANRWLPLEIDYRAGTLAGELELERLAWRDEDLSLELRGLRLAVSPACLWHSRICFEWLHARELEIVLLPGTDADSALPQSAGDDSLLVFPVPLEAEDLQLDSLLVSWDGGEWRQGALAGAVKIRGSTVRVERALVQDARLRLYDTGEPVPAGEPVVLPEIDLPLELLVSELVLEHGSWDLYGEGGELQSLRLSGEWRQHQLALAKLYISSAVVGEWNAAGHVEFSGNWPLALQGQVTVPGIPAWPSQLERNIALTASGDLAALSVQADGGGQVSLSSRALLNTLDPLLPFHLSATAEWPGSMDLAQWVQLPQALAGAALTGPLNLDASGDLASQVFQLKCAATVPGFPSVGVLLAGSHRQGLLEVEDLHLEDANQANTLWGTAQLRYGDRIEISAQLESGGLDLKELGGYASGHVEGQLQLAAEISGDRWQVSVPRANVKGTINGLPARLGGHVGIDSDLHLLPSDLHADINGARLVLLAYADPLQQDRVELSVDDIARWLPDARGALSLQAVATPQWDDFTLSGKLEEIRLPGVELAFGTVRGHYKPGGSGQFNLDVSVEDLVAGPVEFGSVALSGRGSESGQGLSLRTEGDITGQLEVNGKFTDGGKWQGQLAPTTLQTREGNWYLSEAVAIGYSPSPARLQLAAHCWQFQNTRVCPGEVLLAEEGRASARLTGDLQFLAAFFPEYLELRGVVSATVSAGWSPGKPLALEAEARASDIKLTRHYGEGDSGTVTWQRLDVRAHNGAAGLVLEADAYHDEQRTVALALQMPAGREEPVSGALEIDGLQLGMFAAFAPTLSILEGELAGSLELHGTVDKPLARGALRLSGGHFALVDNPTELSGLSLLLEAQGDTAQVQGNGLLGGGQLDVSGELSSQPQWRLALALQGSRHEILLPPATQMLVSEKIDLQVSAGLLGLGGNIIVHEGTLQHEQLPEGSVTLSDDVVEVDLTGNVIYEPAPFGIDMNIDLLIEDNFRILGDMVNATVGGELQLRQEPYQPLQVFGNLNVIGGELRAYQQRLRVQRGTIAFSGTPDNPELNVRAQREISAENITVGLQLQGTLEQPKLDIFSDPVMSQGETMSYLVRGRGLDSGAGADGVAMALSVGTGLVNQSALVTELNSIPGISNLAFGAEGSTEADTTATVGGYIGERLYLSYGMGIYEPINVLTARLYLQTRLWLEVVSRLENSVDIYYSFDIE